MVFLVWASADVGSGVYVKTFCRSSKERREVALTFDDGPSGNTHEVLDVLREYGVKATFFLVGREVERYPELAQRIVRDGHDVGNHTYSHSWTFPLRSGAAVRVELQRCSASMVRVLGFSPTLFRPPFGVTNPVIGRVVRSLQLRAVGWSIRSFDTLRRRSRRRTTKRVLTRLDAGAVILLHDRCDGSGALVRELIEGIAAQGYTFTTIGKMQRDENKC